MTAITLTITPLLADGTGHWITPDTPPTPQQADILITNAHHITHAANILREHRA